MAEKRTYVKRVMVCRPVKSINEAASGVVVGTGRATGDILVNKLSSNLYEPGKLVAGHGLDKSYGDSASNNIVMSLDSSELKQIIDSDYIKFMTGQTEEHTSELQSRLHLVCRLLLEKKKKYNKNKKKKTKTKNKTDRLT